MRQHISWHRVLWTRNLIKIRVKVDLIDVLIDFGHRQLNQVLVQRWRLVLNCFLDLFKYLGRLLVLEVNCDNNPIVEDIVDLVRSFCKFLKFVLKPDSDTIQFKNKTFELVIYYLVVLVRLIILKNLGRNNFNKLV